MYPGQMYPLPLLILMMQSPTTPGQFDPFLLPQSNIVVESPTTPGQFDMWRKADVPRSDVPPPSIDPNGAEPYYTRSI